MKRLILLRHAKSSWDDPGLQDEDRPLAPRGERAVGTVARWLADQELRLDLVLCSSALRARQTLDGVSSALGDARVEVERRLYTAEAGDLLDRLRSVPEETASVLLIAHNPGLQDLAVELTTNGEVRERLTEKFPTAGVAVLTFDGAWATLRPGSARIAVFAGPREMT
jgi:phosphohistidine phosphatase